MDTIINLLQYQLTQIILSFVVGMIFAYYFTASKARLLKNENQKLSEHLNTHLKVTARGNQELEKENEEVKKKNENLRISLAALKNKPEKIELRKLYLYDKAIHLMYERAPGFAASWEIMLKEAEEELDKVDTGILAWVRRSIRPSLTYGSDTQKHPQNDGHGNDKY